MIEADRVTDLGGAVRLIDTPSASGSGQVIARCPQCKVAVWSNYAGAGPLIKFIRVGTLDNPDLLPPDIHIFTASKQPWVQLPEGTPAVVEYYERERQWSAEGLQRFETLLPRIKAYRAARRALHEARRDAFADATNPALAFGSGDQARLGVPARP